jgi:hypothetical protein
MINDDDAQSYVFVWFLGHGQKANHKMTHCTPQVGNTLNTK